MASLASNLIFILISVTFVLGQTVRPSLFGIQVTLIDILLPLFALINAFFFLSQKQKPLNKPFQTFLYIAWITLAVNLLWHRFDFIKPIFYLVRLTSLISFFIFPLNLSQKLYRFFNLCLVSNIIFGFYQYFFHPDFTYFDAQNWDPHLYRLVSTFFDPTFTGLIYLLFIISLLPFNTTIAYLTAAITYLAISFSYSRSTFISLDLASVVFSFYRRNINYFFITTILIISSILLLPRQPGEGTKLERTSSILAKIENYSQAFHYISQSPIIGYGYNTLSQVRTDLNRESHAVNGFDNSLLTIWSTAGIFGLIFFSLGLFYLTQNVSIYFNMILISVLSHSLFANSLLYPWILFYLAVLYSRYRKSN